MFRYELVNSTRKFTIVAEIVSLLKKIYKRDAPFRAVFKVKTLAVLFSAYPREMKHIPRNLNLPPFWRCLFLWKWCNPFPRARARLKHAHSFDRCRGQRSRFLVLTKRSAASGDENGRCPEELGVSRRDENLRTLIPLWRTFVLFSCRTKVNLHNDYIYA